MKREIYMSNLPDLTSSYTRKKKNTMLLLCHSRVNLFGWQRWRQLCTCTTNTTGFFLRRRVSLKKMLYCLTANGRAFFVKL